MGKKTMIESSLLSQENSRFTTKVKYPNKKISKNRDKKHHQQRQKIELLKPKVYITDYSSFKTLVQELTGNGSLVSSAPVNLEEDHHAWHENNNCNTLHDMSFDSSEGSAPTAFGFSMETYSTGPCIQQQQQQTDLSMLESWLLDTTTYYNDHRGLYDDDVYVPVMVQEEEMLSVDDYENIGFSYEDYFHF